MALQMPVYREINLIEPKVMGGLTWRQWFAAAGMAALGGGSWAVLALWLHLDDVASLVVLAVCLPFAAFGWWRPSGLMPERWLPYAWAYWFGQRRFLYAGEAARPWRTPARPSMRERDGK
ncbi:PrgI family protein [Bifidobacterium margollesii]|uniref:PrgI family protein n=1 Tax=Bifidobacterium margollesii TaxID=2020964 RepID=A0A2N5J7C0_9BIFI|nr:PrgI family protein [Bifidobacterium margollesii]PLS30109.1 PrgI family protein [Bifidobacterium margollesii]